MGFVTKRNDGDDGGGGGDEESLGLDLQPPRCATCRRELLPWEQTCPDDGGRAVHPGELTPEPDPLLARLLSEDDTPTPDPCCE